LAEQVLAHALAPAGVLVFGLLVLAANPRLPAPPDGATGLLGAAADYLIGPPEQFTSGPAVVPVASLFLADALRICVALPATPALCAWPFSWPLSAPPPVSTPSSPGPSEHSPKKARGCWTSCS
jgi:hypothetical protein